MVRGSAEILQITERAATDAKQTVVNIRSTARDWLRCTTSQNNFREFRKYETVRLELDRYNHDALELNYQRCHAEQALHSRLINFQYSVY